MRMTRRVALLLAAVLVAALGGSLVIHAWTVSDALRQQLVVRNDDAAAGLAVSLSQQRGDMAALQSVVAAHFDLGHYARVLLRSSDGHVLVERRAEERRGRAPAWFVRALAFDVPPGTAVVSSGWRELGRVQVSAQAAWTHDALWAAGQRTAVWMALLAGFAAAAAGVLLRSWQRPLAATVAQARALEQGRFVTAPEPGVPELRELTRSMNATVARLSTVFEAQGVQVALLERQAHADPVTGLPQRLRFVARLQQALTDLGGPAAALVIVRVRHLDAMNQRLGHDGTDRVLCALADVLMTYVDRVPGTFAGRLNGADFALCLPAGGVAQDTADSLFAALAASPVARNGGAEWAVGGIEHLQGLAVGEVLSAADAALAQAEADGMVVVQMRDGGSASPPGARAWRAEIAQALAERRVELGEFPVLDPQGRLLHLECPLRVQRVPGGEFQAARRWLALAARSRLLPQVDLCATEQVLSAIARDGRSRCVHVAPVSLATPGFAPALQALLDAAPRAAGRLWIELDGAGGAGVPELLAPVVPAWRRLGVTVGVEHAGAAPQGLPALQRAGIDYVKVDARHLRGLADDPAVRDYAQSLLALVHGLNLRAVAEGVDDARNLPLLWSMGYDGATGPAVREATGR